MFYKYFEAFLTGCKLSILTETAFKKITNLTNNDIKFLTDENYFKKETYYIDKEKYECVQITSEGIKYAKRNYGYKKIYYSNSEYHDIKHSENVANMIEEFGVSIKEYKSEKELEKQKGTTRVDGVLELNDRRIGIETVTTFYKDSQIQKKKEYCNSFDIEYCEFRV